MRRSLIPRHLLWCGQCSGILLLGQRLGTILLREDPEPPPAHFRLCLSLAPRLRGFWEATFIQWRSLSSPFFSTPFYPPRLDRRSLVALIYFGLEIELSPNDQRRGRGNPWY